MKTILILFALWLVIPINADGQNLLKRWVFKRKVDAVTHAISEGDPLRVQWRDLKGKGHTDKGRLVALQDSSLVLESKDGHKIYIPAKRVYNIGVLKNKRGSQEKAGMIALGAGVTIGLTALILGGIALLALALITVATFGLASDRKEEKRVENQASAGCLIGFLVILIGIILLFSPRGPKYEIVRPFSGEWELTQTEFDPVKEAEQGLAP